MSRVATYQGVALRRLRVLLRASSVRTISCLEGETSRGTRRACNGRIFVQKLVRFDGCYGGSYLCYNVERDGARTSHCHLDARRVVTYYRDNCRLNFHAFILRKNRSPCCASRHVYRVISKVGTGCPSYTIALSVKRGSGRDCRDCFSTKTSECLLHRRATSRGRCDELRPTRVSLRGEGRYL